jgi:7-carboxy-7-deazaguanine synthase
MSYAVKEIHYTLQGEGARTGRAAVFCRFTGCNLWSGREQDRATAQCPFCDTDFIGTDGHGGGTFDTAEKLAKTIAAYWTGNDVGGDVENDAGTATAKPYVVFTGGEPLLQLDETLIKALQVLDFEVAIETNGTLPAPPGVDWICVSPKAGTAQVQTTGHELKVIFPQEGFDPLTLSGQAFANRFIQPMDMLGDDAASQVNLDACIAFCRDNPAWRLSLQTHKLLGIP